MPLTVGPGNRPEGGRWWHAPGWMRRYPSVWILRLREYNSVVILTEGDSNGTISRGHRTGQRMEQVVPTVNFFDTSGEHVICVVLRAKQ